MNSQTTTEAKRVWSQQNNPIYYRLISL